MHRIDSEGSVGGRFTDGNPQSGQEATIVDAEWLNSIQETIANLIGYANIALIKGNDQQLTQAIIALIAGVVGTGGGSVPTTRVVTGGGLVTGGGALAADLTLSVAKASAADVLAGTNDSKAVTPLSLATGFARVLAAAGYITFPLGGGFMLQWLSSTINNDSQAIYTLPTTFPNACVGAWVNGGRPVIGAGDNTFVSGFGQSNVSVYNAENVPIGINIFAIGY